MSPADLAPITLQRIVLLRQEYDKGQQRLQELRAEQAGLQETVLRIEGAITVLQELLNGEGAEQPAFRLQQSST